MHVTVKMKKEANLSFQFLQLHHNIRISSAINPNFSIISQTNGVRIVTNSKKYFLSVAFKEIIIILRVNISESPHIEMSNNCPSRMTNYNSVSDRLIPPSMSIYLILIERIMRKFDLFGFFFPNLNFRNYFQLKRCINLFA